MEAGGRFIGMEMGHLEENIRNKFSKCSRDGTIFFILLLSVSVNISKAFSSFISAVSETISLILNGSMG